MKTPGNEFGPVTFTRLSPAASYTMRFQPNLTHSNESPRYVQIILQRGYRRVLILSRVFALAGAFSSFTPAFDAIDYDIANGSYTTTLRGSVVHSGTFELHPRLRIPALAMEADISYYSWSAHMRPYLKVYNTTENPNALDAENDWEDNTGVVMRASHSLRPVICPLFCSTDVLAEKELWICAKDADDPLKSPGDLLAVPVGLLVLARGDKNNLFHRTLRGAEGSS